MQSIKLEIIDGQVKVVTPYNDEFVAKARNFRGKWREGAWWFDDSIVDYVRDAMNTIFGTTGEIPYQNCVLQIIDFSEEAFGGPVKLFGKTIAIAFGRDSYAKLGDDIVFIDGEYSSGGSVKNWKTSVCSATFEIHNFPLPQTELPGIQDAIKSGWCTIKQAKTNRESKTIKAEIEVLENRIKELKTELNNL